MIHYTLLLGFTSHFQLATVNLFFCGMAYPQARRSIRLQAMWPMVM